MSNHLLKRRANYVHFKRRLYQRHGIGIDYDEYLKAIENVRFGGRRYLIEEQTNTRALYWVMIRYKMVRVVYSSITKDLVTAL